MVGPSLPRQDALSLSLVLVLLVVMAMGEVEWCSWRCAVFTLQWPSGFCQSLRNQSECSIPEQVNDWTIHGLWPQTNRSCGCWPLFVSDIQELEEELNQQWPTLLKTHSSFQFWSAEWRKHGSVAACDEGLNSPLKYFLAGLSLREKFNLSRVLQSAAITPSCDQHYQVKEIRDLLAPSLGERSEIQCVTGQQDRELLFQVKIPLSRNLTVGCENSLVPRSSTRWPGSSPHPCPPDGFLYLLPIDHQHPSEPCAGANSTVLTTESIRDIK